VLPLMAALASGRDLASDPAPRFEAERSRRRVRDSCGKR
jgi:hypothetical protein